MQSIAIVEQETEVVTAVFLLHETADVAIFRVDTAPKYPQNG